MTSLILTTQGMQGPRGDGGAPYRFSSQTTMTDPGTGRVRANASTLAAATQIAISASSAAAGNPVISEMMTRWFASTSAIKGLLRLTSNASPDAIAAEFEVTAVDDQTTHLMLTVQNGVAIGALNDNDPVSLVPVQRTGDKGDTPAIGDGSIDNANLADMAPGTFKARASAGSGPPEDLTAYQMRMALGIDSSAEVDAKIAALVATAPATLDTLNELAAALGNDPDFATTITNLLAGKEPIDPEILRADTDDSLTAGYTVVADDDGVLVSGTYTPAPAGGNYKRIINGGPFTLAAPVEPGDYDLKIEITNDANAGPVTLSGFGHEAPGDSFDTVNGNRFIAYIEKLNGQADITIRKRQA